MKILSITTSSPICGVAILENETPIKEINLNNGLTHSETLMPLIKQILDETNLNLNNIDLLAVDIGPGSFTGIRIGIATAMAFHDSLNIKTVGVTSLEALSLNSKSNNLICTLIDAKKENVYNEIFEFTPTQCLVKRKASFDNINNLISQLKNSNPAYNLTFIGDGATQYKNKILKELPNSDFIQNNNLSAINTGKYAYLYSSTDTFSRISPLYLRKSPAERNLE